MPQRYDCADPIDRVTGLKAAVSACRRGDLVLVPTETVYGLATDAFSAVGASRIRQALGRSRQHPLPVLIGRSETADGLVLNLAPGGRDLLEAFWPGQLTVIARAQPSLRWDIGDTEGTVSLRMPIHPVALELLRETGPLAVTSAAPSGLPPARTALDAELHLSTQLAVVLDAGELPEGGTSTVVDITGDVPRMVRSGAVSLEVLREVVPDLLDADL